MKIPPPFPPPSFSVSPLAVSVYSNHYFKEVVAFLHEEGKKSAYYVKMRIALEKEGMVEEIYEKKLIHKEIFSPPDPEEIVSNITRRIKHFARRYKVSSDRIFFY